MSAYSERDMTPEQLSAYRFGRRQLFNVSTKRGESRLVTYSNGVTRPFGLGYAAKNGLLKPKDA